MIIDFNKSNGGGGSGSGSTDLTNYWNSAVTEQHIESAASITYASAASYTDQAVAGIDLSAYDTAAVASTKYSKVTTYPVSGNDVDLGFLYIETSGVSKELNIAKINGKAVIGLNQEYRTEFEFPTSGDVQTMISGALSGFTPAGNSNILAAISSLTEYEAISGNVKTGDLIQVLGVDINGDGGEYGLFQADVQEIEDQGVITKEIIWERRDSSDSLNWNYKDYPWMTDNDVYPVDLGSGSFLISLAEGGYNGIGFDGDGKPVITHIVPEEDEQTGEITGMTREDTPIGGGLPVGYEAADFALNDNYQIVTVDGKVFGEDLYDIPAFHSFENGYSDPDRGYVSGAWTKVFGYYDEDENFVPVFLPAGTYAVLDTDDDQYNGKVINLFYGKVGDEDVIYNNTFYAEDLDSISLKSPLFTITEPTCPTTEDNYYELYLDYTDKPSAQSQIDTLDQVVSAALVDLNERVNEKVESQDIKHIVKLTQAQYDQLATKDPETFYIIITNNN